jgi:hypothetical protein
MQRFAMLLVVLAAALPDHAVAAEDKARPVATIDVVLCLDVSSSMDDLILSAKAKLWDLVNELGAVKPTPRLRVGLYSYGSRDYDAKRGFVRKEVDLTTDLDTVYKQLNGLRIAGRGSDELVARVCRDALAEQKWSAEKKALKLIFVCGNEPADQDKEVTLEAVARAAIEKDVIINTIHCKWGSANAGEELGWRNLALKAEGRFSQIDMKRGTIVLATPQDRKLEELGRKLNTTYVAYGLKEVREAKTALQADQDGTAERLRAGASRAITKATVFYRNSDWCLVDRLKEDPKFDVTKVPEAELTDELKKMKPAERVAHVKKKLAERESIQKEIAELSKQRSVFLEQAAKKDAGAREKAFDDAVRAALRDQAKKKGFTVPK